MTQATAMNRTELVERKGYVGEPATGVAPAVAAFWSALDQVVNVLSIPGPNIRLKIDFGMHFERAPLAGGDDLSPAPSRMERKQR